MIQNQIIERHITLILQHLKQKYQGKNGGRDVSDDFGVVIIN